MEIFQNFICPLYQSRADYMIQKHCHHWKHFVLYNLGCFENNLISTSTTKFFVFFQLFRYIWVLFIMNPHYNEVNCLVTWHFVILGFHCGYKCGQVTSSFSPLKHHGMNIIWIYIVSFKIVVNWGKGKGVNMYLGKVTRGGVDCNTKGEGVYMYLGKVTGGGVDCNTKGEGVYMYLGKVTARVSRS